MDSSFCVHDRSALVATACISYVSEHQLASRRCGERSFDQPVFGECVRQCCGVRSSRDNHCTCVVWAKIWIILVRVYVCVCTA